MDAMTKILNGIPVTNIEFYVSKVDKRLWILDWNTQEKIYSPPEFIRKKLTSREQLQELCDAFNELGRRDIDSIVAFEKAFVKD